MKTKSEKLHVGLITTDKSHENDLKKTLEETGGGYVHTGRSLLEMHQKMGLQKVQLIVAVSSDSDFGQESQALIHFFRSKREHAKTPICVLTPKDQMLFKVLLLDPRVRCFPLSGGMFLPLVTMLPLAQSPDLETIVEPLATAWVQSEFESSAKDKLGQGLVFAAGPSTDDDLHAGFIAQSAGEVRSHLGWFKFSVRILDENQSALSRILGTGSHDDLERIGQTLLEHIMFDFNEKVVKELQTRGAFFYPEMDQLAPADRKTLYGRSKTTGLTFRSDNVSLVLQVTQYI